jgi:hypothetical protein
MTKSINNLLSYLVVASGAVRSLGKTGCGTGRCYCRIGYHIVTECVNNSLCYENLVTYRTMLTLGKTGRSTSGSYSLIDYLGVTECRNCYLLTALLFSAVTTVNYAIVRAGRGTGSSYNVLTNCGSVAMSIGRLACLSILIIAL